MIRSTFYNSLSRRGFLKQAAIGGVALVGSSSQMLSAAEKPKEHSLRVISYNVYNCTGWPKDRALAHTATAKGQMAERFALELALYSPDIINFSESPAEPLVQEIAKLLQMNYVFFPSGGNWPGALLSRYEIVDSENVPLGGRERAEDLFTRHWGKATVRLPSGEALDVHSVHLRPPPSSDIRIREIHEMLKAMQSDLKAGRSMLLIGDLNHSPASQEYPLWIDAGWVDTFAAVGKGEGLTIKSDKPDLRFDYVLATGPIAQTVVESRPLFEGAFRTNTSDPSSFALSDHLPQLAVFR
ncbi:MAG: twin-arginine translocation signal domain-containing protein [Planctomycetes bacterium]|nr:twin-arginine translocation signal domain-containing protein [Planctomycetota bacterium]